MLDEINLALEKFAAENGLEKVFYGAASDRLGKMKNWNYIILKRDRNARSGKSNTDSTMYYTVTLVHEDYIPEGMAEELAKTILNDVPGMHFTSDIEYDYGFKNGTDMVVEAAIIQFYKAQKGCGIWRR